MRLSKNSNQIYKAVVVASLVALSTQSLADVCEGKFVRPSYKTRGYYCASGQTVRDAYTVGREIPCEEMEVDHLISLRQAWDSGVCGEELKRLANDPRNLKFTHWRTNRAKGYLPAEEFANRLPSKVSEGVLRDAENIMREYRIKSPDEAVEHRMLAYATDGPRARQIPLSSINGAVRKSITTRQIAGRTIAFIGKRAVGYASGAGLGIEMIMIAGWAANWMTEPSQDSRMKKRAVFFNAVLEGKE